MSGLIDSSGGLNFGTGLEFRAGLYGGPGLDNNILKVFDIAHNASNVAALSLSVTIPAGGIPAGSLLVVIGAMRGATFFNISDSRSNSYSINTGSATYNAGADVVNLYATFNSKALLANDTVTISTGSNFTAAAMELFYATGIRTVSDPHDYNNANTGSSTTPTISTQPTVVANELIVAYTAVNGPTTDTYTEDALYTSLSRVGTTGAVNVTLNTGFRLVTAIGTYTHSPTLGTSEAWFNGMGSFKAA